MKLDEESKQFIDWSMEKLDGEDFRGNFLATCVMKFNKWVVDNQHTLQPRLKAKLEAGGREYGAPDYTLEKVDEELEMEFIDIIGWSLVRKWNEQKKS